MEEFRYWYERGPDDPWEQPKLLHPDVAKYLEEQLTEETNKSFNENNKADEEFLQRWYAMDEKEQMAIKEEYEGYLYSYNININKKNRKGLKQILICSIIIIILMFVLIIKSISL